MAGAQRRSRGRLREDGPMNNIIDRLKRFNAETANPDEMVELLFQARGLRAEYEHQNVEVPVWLDDSTRTIKRELDARLADQRAMRIRQLEAELAGLQTREEKRDAVREELARLKGEKSPTTAH